MKPNNTRAAAPLRPSSSANKRRIVSRAPLLFVLLPLALAHAADPLARPELFKRMDNNDIPLEDLTHSFLLHGSSSLDSLKEIISEDGISALEQEVAEHRRDMNDNANLAAKARKLCKDLHDAKSGQEFAAVFFEGEKTDRKQERQAMRRILSKLSADDRMALEDYLDTEYRPGVGINRTNWEAMFAYGPFPSAETAAVTQRACEAAVQFEGRVEP